MTKMVAIPQEGLARKEWVTTKKPDWSLHRGFCWCLERFRPDLEPSQQEVSTSGFFPPSKPVISRVCGFRRITAGDSCLHKLTDRTIP